MPICRDCRHLVIPRDVVLRDYSTTWLCVSPKNPETADPVTGALKRKISYCVAQREGPAPKYCGPDGAWFEATV